MTANLRALLPVAALVMAACVATTPPGEPTRRELEGAFIAALEELPSEPYELKVAGERAPMPLHRQLRLLGHQVVPESRSREWRNVYLKEWSDQQLVVVVNRGAAFWSMDYTVTMDRLGRGRVRVVDVGSYELEH